MKPRLYVDQKITAFVNKYKVHGAGSTGDKANLQAFAQQKRLAFKEKVTFYTDEKKTSEAFTLRAEKVFDVHGRYLVEDLSGNLVGMFRKEFKKSLVSSSWVIMDTDGSDVYRVRESNIVIAVLRRFIGWVPYIGDIFEILIKFFRYHFVFEDIQNGDEAGRYEKKTLFRDHYCLSMTDAAYERVDWRVLAAMGVALDALQSR